MKKSLRVLILVVFIISMLTVISNAATMNIIPDKQTINAKDEFNINIKTDKNLETATFYIKYDNDKLEYVETEKTNIMEKDYPDEGTLRVVYYDLTLKGTNELSFKFKAKEKVSGMANIEITNLTAQCVNDSEVYTNSNMKNSNFKTTIEIVKPVLSTWIIVALIIVAILLVLLVIVNKIHKHDKEKAAANKTESKTTKKDVKKETKKVSKSKKNN